MIIPGATYQHYKGQEYRVLHLAKNEIDETDVVVYQALYGDHKIWVRPITSFMETVMLNGEPLPRFAIL